MAKLDLTEAAAVLMRVDQSGHQQPRAEIDRGRSGMRGFQCLGGANRAHQVALDQHAMISQQRRALWFAQAPIGGENRCGQARYPYGSPSMKMHKSLPDMAAQKY